MRAKRARRDKKVHRLGSFTLNQPLCKDEQSIFYVAKDPHSVVKHVDGTPLIFADMDSNETDIDASSSLQQQKLSPLSIGKLATPRSYRIYDFEANSVES